MSSTRSLAERRIAETRGRSSGCGWLLLLCVASPLLLLLLAARRPSQAPIAIIESVRPVEAIGAVSSAVLPSRGRRDDASSSDAPPWGTPPPADEQDDGAPSPKSSSAAADADAVQPMAILNRERASQAAAEHRGAFKVYRPASGASRPGGDMDDPKTLPRAVAASAAEGEVMILCIGGAGSMRAGMNLVMNFRAMQLYNMLILAPEAAVCDDLWTSLPSLACVWWPSKFTQPRPKSLYNTMFSRTALAFFEARKLLLERLVVGHRLNVLHLDADTVWFANPYPIFKTVYKEYSLIIQTDNPFVNAGIMYVQNVQPGDATAWVLEELNRRIDRFTYRPESVKELPNSGWSTPPHFANADEQANFNDIVTTALNGKPTYSAGVEFYEARFKRDKGDKAAADKMRDGRWTQRMQQGDVSPARRGLQNLSPRHEYDSVVHLCKMSIYGACQVVPLSVPGNATARKTKMLLAPEWLFSHFPYGAFFPSFRECHADSWRWEKASALEQRLCMPTFRVPVVMVHMAGLRNGQWGRRGVMRALGVWHEAADTVATAEWVSPRTQRLLVTDGLVEAGRFRSMAAFDRFAARLLMLGLLLRRRVVMPPMPCASNWAQAAMEPRHLRGLEVGCGPHKQCAWLPMPHFKEAWCSGVDFLYDIDYRELVSKGGSVASDVATLDPSTLTLAARAPSGEPLVRRAAGAEPLPDATTLVLRAPPGSSGEPLGWMPINDFKSKRWDVTSLARLAEALRAPEPGLGLSASQMGIVKDCMHSLATSKD